MSGIRATQQEGQPGCILAPRELRSRLMANSSCRALSMALAELTAARPEQP